MNYPDFFSKAAGGSKPYPYQTALAVRAETPALMRVPTGAGKTEAVILGWLYRRFEHPDKAIRQSEPRRLVYCLPMRALVEQTESRARTWLANLGWSDRVGLTVLMGGAPREEWHLEPEKPRIVIGTQDMLLSRALNRGYGLSPFMWPIEYGLLNNDCLWVMDEAQLMGDALATTAQLAGLRKKLCAYGTSRSLWMSATVSAEWLETPDHPAPESVFELADADFADERLSKRRNAVKTVSEKTVADRGYEKSAANLALEKRQPGALTLVVINTVERARKVYGEIVNAIERERKAAERAARRQTRASRSRRNEPKQLALVASAGEQEKSDTFPRVSLLHSRFRRDGRKKIQDRLLSERAPDPAGAGEIVVATQVVESGLDISARVLISEIAPWASMVQRLGRCNRAGEFDSEGGGEFIWLNREKWTKGKAEPYEEDAIAKSAEIMRGFNGESASPAELERANGALEDADYAHIIRRVDVERLFDNSADLSGGYTDVSRYIRDVDEKSAFVFWRDLSDGKACAQSRARRDEVVSIPLGEVKKYADAKKGGNPQRPLWVWDFIAGEWTGVGHADIRAGMTVMLDSKLGGYSEETGWNVGRWDEVDPVAPSHGETETAEDGHESDPNSVGQTRAVTLADHSRHVERETKAIVAALGMRESDPDAALSAETAALFHDAGKVHPAFQTMLRAGETPDADAPPLAKSAVDVGNAKNERPQFRHEIGGAMAVLQNADNLAEGGPRDLAAYLAMSHHGKVRLMAQPLSRRKNETPPSDFLLGWDMNRTEFLDRVDLGEGAEIPKTRVDAAAESQIGGSPDGEGRSWQDRARAVLEKRGPFRLAYLEAIVRAADHRASAKERME